MAAESNFLLVWIIYLAASVCFYAVFWWVTGFEHAKWRSYSLRAVAAAVIFTPWYANTGGETMAPALMVMTLDLITIGAGSVTRAAVPLLLSILVAEAAATSFYFLKRRQKKPTPESENNQ